MSSESDVEADDFQDALSELDDSGACSSPTTQKAPPQSTSNFILRHDLKLDNVSIQPLPETKESDPSIDYITSDNAGSIQGGREKGLPNGYRQASPTSDSLLRQHLLTVPGKSPTYSHTGGLEFRC